MESILSKYLFFFFQSLLKGLSSFSWELCPFHFFWCNIYIIVGVRSKFYFSLIMSRTKKASAAPRGQSSPPPLPPSYSIHWQLSVSGSRNRVNLDRIPWRLVRRPRPISGPYWPTGRAQQSWTIKHTQICLQGGGERLLSISYSVPGGCKNAGNYIIISTRKRKDK